MEYFNLYISNEFENCFKCGKNTGKYFGSLNYRILTICYNCHLKIIQNKNENLFNQCYLKCMHGVIIEN